MKVKRWLCAVVLCGLCIVLGACGATTKTVSQSPALRPGAIAPPAGQSPSCDLRQQHEVEEGRGHLGVCAPRSTAPTLTAPARARGGTGPDVSNNDAFFQWRSVRAHGHAFVYDKVIQGTRFIDSTAAGMARAQRAAGMIPGGYDFLEVCRTSATGEARLFAARLKAIGLVSHAMTPMGDAEWPLSVPCSTHEAAVWLGSWEREVLHLTRRRPGFYTGAWWSNPNVGCWLPRGLRWVSGFTLRRLLSIPDCWGGVDLWQYTDSGFNGETSTDMSVLEVPLSRFLDVPAPTPAQKRASKVRSLREHERERQELHVDIDKHHCRPGQHSTPREPLSKRHRYHELCARWLKRGGVVIGTIKRYRHELGIR